MSLKVNPADSPLHSPAWKQRCLDHRERGMVLPPPQGNGLEASGTLGKAFKSHSLPNVVLQYSMGHWAQ